MKSKADQIVIDMYDCFQHVNRRANSRYDEYEVRMSFLSDLQRFIASCELVLVEVPDQAWNVTALYNGTDAEREYWATAYHRPHFQLLASMWGQVKVAMEPMMLAYGLPH